MNLSYYKVSYLTPAFCGHLYKDNGLRYDENFQLNKTKQNGSSGSRVLYGARRWREWREMAWRGGRPALGWRNGDAEY